MAFTLTNKYHTKERSLESQIIAHLSPTSNNYQANQALNRHTIVNCPSAKDILFICSIQLLLVAMPIFLFQFGRVEINIGHMVMAKGGSTIWILLVKFLECKLGADLMYPCGTYV